MSIISSKSKKKIVSSDKKDDKFIETTLERLELLCTEIEMVRDTIYDLSPSNVEDELGTILTVLESISNDLVLNRGNKK